MHWKALPHTSTHGQAVRTDSSREVDVEARLCAQWHKDDVDTQKFKFQIKEADEKNAQAIAVHKAAEDRLKFELEDSDGEK